MTIHDPHNRTAPLCALHNAGVRRHGRWLVRGIDLAVRQGEIVTLIGPNGAGKTTTARMALGLIRPNEGRADRKQAVTVGYVPQTMTVDWTVPITVGRFMRLTGRPAPAQIDAALTRVGVAHLTEANLKHLSGGEFQRVLLARALARTPDLLVLDEPVRGVDHIGEAALYRLISDLRTETGCGVLLISHDLHMVMAATDTVICLNGHICCQGNPGAVALDPEYRRLFGQPADPALALYEHRHDHVHLSDGTVRPNDSDAAGDRHA